MTLWKLWLPCFGFGRSESFSGAVPKLELGNQDETRMNASYSLLASGEQFIVHLISFA
jgi:hypothetical protein